MGRLIEVEVAFLSMDARSNLPIVFLREKEREGENRRYLPIWIGIPEASAILVKLSGEVPKRPLTHDLMNNILRELKVKVESVAVVAIKDNTFYGQINLRKGNRRYHIDSRPSDAIALALRAEAPIFVDEEVLNESGLSEKMIEEMTKRQARMELIEMDEEEIDKYKV